MTIKDTVKKLTNHRRTLVKRAAIVGGVIVGVAVATAVITAKAQRVVAENTVQNALAEEAVVPVEGGEIHFVPDVKN